MYESMFFFLSCTSISRPYRFCSLMNFLLVSSTSVCSFPEDSCSYKCILSDSRSAVSAFNELSPLQSLFWSFIRLCPESRTITCTTCRQVCDPLSASSSFPFLQFFARLYIYSFLLFSFPLFKLIGISTLWE